MRRHVVVGAGAVGCLLAAQWHLAGAPVLLVARGEALAAVRRAGVLVRRPHGDERVPVPVAAADEVRLTPDDVLVLAVKAQHAADTLAAWAWRPVVGGGLGADLPVVTVQNGLAAEDEALRRFAHVLAGTVAVEASHLEPGVVVSPSFPVVARLWLGRYRGLGAVPDPAPDPLAVDLAAGLTAAGLDATALADVVPVKVAKLLVNVANGLDVLDGPAELRSRARKTLVAEARTVLGAAGLHPGPELAAGPRLQVLEVPGHVAGRYSTWQSFARGVSSEADHLNGEIVRLARLHGVPAPCNERLQRLLGALAARGGRPGEVHLDALLPLPDAPTARPAHAPEGVRATLLTDVAALARDLGLTPAAHAPGPPRGPAPAGASDPDAPPLVLDVRWSLGGPTGHGEYLRGHVPGAVYVDLDTELAGPSGPGVGRHPLPDTATLRAALRRWGLTPGRPVVVLDDWSGYSAARAWWVLTWAGVPHVRILDGGLAAWRAAGLPLATDDVVPEPSAVEVRPGALPVLDADAALDLARRGGRLLDARSAGRYRGELPGIDPVPGHVPGAISAPTSENLAPDGTFLPGATLAARFAALGVGTHDEVGVYCGSGVTAAHQIVALRLAGHPAAALYAGSWSQWATTPGRPVVAGPDPDGPRTHVPR